MHHNNGPLVGYHGMSYIISNLPKVATWRSKGLRIRPLIAEKTTTLLFRGTFGHGVGCVIAKAGWRNLYLPFRTLVCEMLLSFL